MSNAIESRIKERIQAFVTELDTLVRKSTLEALRGVLEGGGAARTRRGRGRGPGRAAGSDGADGLPGRISSHVRANPGQTVGQIVSATGARAPVVKRTIKSMLAGKQLRKAGQRRGTRYYPAGAGRLPGAGRKRGKRRGRRSKAA